jgi:magnesium transporter
LFGAFGFAAQSLLAALGAVQFISNVLFSHFVLGYDITVRIFAATMTIVVGEVFVVVFSNHVSTQYEVSHLQHFYTYIDYQVVTSIWNYLNPLIRTKKMK